MKKRFSAIEQALGNNGERDMAFPGQDDQAQGGDAGGVDPMLMKNAAGLPGDPALGQSQGALQGQGAFNDIRDDLAQLIRQGKLPKDFDLQAACADEAFADLMLELPPEAAVRVYAAEKRAEEAEAAAMQRVSNQLKSRNALPRSTRGGAMGAPSVNYRDMDSASFRRLLGNIKKTTRNGGQVRL